MEEPDDRPLSLFAKDGDTFALIPDLQQPDEVGCLPATSDHGQQAMEAEAVAGGAATAGAGGGGGEVGRIPLLLSHDSSAGPPSLSSLRGHATAEPSPWGLPQAAPAPVPAAAPKRPYRSAAAAQEDLPYCPPEHEGRKRRAEAATVSQVAAAAAAGFGEGPYLGPPTRSLSVESGS